MATKAENQENPETEYRLLSSEERAIINQISTQEPPYSGRAQALLAIDQGATLAEAGRQAGLTFGQARYWHDKFRKDQMSIFPEELLILAQREDAGPPQDSPDAQDLEQSAGKEDAQQHLQDAKDSVGPVDEPEAQPEDASETKRKPKKKSKKKKSKKTKKSKKAKKPKKAKKVKKGNKPTKKSKKKKSTKAKGAKGKSTKKNGKK